MNVFGCLFALIASGMLFSMPRAWASLPILLCSLFINLKQEVVLGPFHFSVLRILIVMGAIRVLLRGEQLVGGLKTIDKLMLVWAAWFVASSVFHESNVFIMRLGEVFGYLGGYFLFRIFLYDKSAVLNTFKALCLMVLPVAAMMVFEKISGRNGFGMLFGGLVEDTVREGRIRAQGPFSHPILAGSTAAVTLPMAIYLRRQTPTIAMLGFAGMVCMIFASASSGPILTALATCGAMGLWQFRSFLSMIRWGALLLIVALDLVMNDPFYFVLARIDLAGGSTGYFRAQLIRSGLQHLNEWWFAGTDFTRHWMASGVGWSAQHTDITNHYLQLGVWGGLPLVLLFVLVLVCGFNAVGKCLRRTDEVPGDDPFLIWTLGSILFGHVATFVSISYFDQSVMFLCIALASIGSLPAVAAASGPIEVDELILAPSSIEPQGYRGP